MSCQNSAIVEPREDLPRERERKPSTCLHRCRIWSWRPQQDTSSIAITAHKVSSKFSQQITSSIVWPLPRGVSRTFFCVRPLDQDARFAPFLARQAAAGRRNYIDFPSFEPATDAHGRQWLESHGTGKHSPWGVRAESQRNPKTRSHYWKKCWKVGWIVLAGYTRAHSWLIGFEV